MCMALKYSFVISCAALRNFHQALRKMNSFSPQHLANTAWAFATLGRRAEVLFRALEQRALELLEFEKELKTLEVISLKTL